ncbi:MAG TPA: ABC transporter substrate-binding protein [Solirubrobacteraceae bacterium]|nr:ABC transporter substrate-binding protein [Solirubrobacteraceae bacterium]
MRLQRQKGFRVRAAAVGVTLAGVVLAGCGEVKNTITPQKNTANQVTLVLLGPPNGFYAGLYEAQALGYFAQTDMDVHIVSPGAGQDSVSMVHGGQALVGISSEPSVLLHRNEDEPVAAVGAIVHVPLPAITIAVHKPSSSGGKAVTTTSTTTHRKTTTTATTTTPTTTTVTAPDATLWPAALQHLLSQPGAPTYDGLVVVARKGTIVEHPGLVRRFVQALAHGYRAARGDPRQAINKLVAAVPALRATKALQLATLKAALPDIFPAGAKIWGWQREAEWNTFGTWMTTHHLLSNPNAITDASTNELLQGQGV